MTSWQTTFYLQFILDNYDKEESNNQKIVQALISYHSPETLIKFIMAKGNPQMLAPNIAYKFYSLIIEYLLNVDHPISSTTLIQILEYLLKILQVRQTPKFFQKIEPLFFIIFSNTVLHYNEKERDFIYQSLKNMSILALSFYTFSPLAMIDQKKFIRNSDNINIIATKTFSDLISLTENLIRTNKAEIRICIQSLAVLFKSGAKIEYDLLTIYSLCDKISKIEPSSNHFNDKLPLYFKAIFFDSLSYFLLPINSLQIAKNHFFNLSSRITTFCTVEDLISILDYSKRILELRKSTEITSFTIDMITEIVFSTILPHFRKSRRLEKSFRDFCDMLDENKLELFVNTHFTTSSDSAKRFLLSEFPNDEQNIEVLFKEQIDHESIHLYLVNSHQRNNSKFNILKYLVHFFEFARLNDFQYLIDIYQLNEYLFCAKTIQYLSICEDFEKMKMLINFLMDDKISKLRRPIIIYSNDLEYIEKVNDCTSVFCVDLAFLSVLYQAVQNPKLNSFIVFLEYLKKCKENSLKNQYSKETVEDQCKSLKKSLIKADSNLEKTPSKSPKKKRRLSSEKVEGDKKTKRRLSDQLIDHTPSFKQYNLLIKQFSQRKFSLTPNKTSISTKHFTKKYFNVSDRFKIQIHNIFQYIQRLINDVNYWNESLLSLLYTKMEKSEVHFCVLVSFFTSDFNIINQMGKLISPYPRLLKKFFAVTLSNNDQFTSELMKYVFYHPDLISFRIDIVLHSILVSSMFIQNVDDRLYELFSVGLMNNEFDLTCTTISSLFDHLSNCCLVKQVDQLTIEYEEDQIDSQFVYISDPELFLMKFCSYQHNGDETIFYQALRGIVNCCFSKLDYRIQKVENIQILIKTIVDTIISMPSQNDIDIEKLLLNNSQNDEYHLNLRKSFVDYLNTINSNEIGYFKCLQRICEILSIEEIKPILNKLFLNFFIDNSKINKIIKKTLFSIFECNFDLNTQSISKIDSNLVELILNDLFSNLNKNDENEKKSCVHFFELFSHVYPKTVIGMQPSPLIQLIRTFSDNSKQNILESTFSILAKCDMVLFFNQLALSPKCELYDQIIFNLCQCPDDKFELFTCIENEFLGLRDQTINFSFAFQILANYIEFQLIYQKVNNDSVYVSILFIFFLIISEYYLSKDDQIFDLFLPVLNLLEIYFGFPLMTVNPPDSIEKVFDVIPFPLFSDLIVIKFLDRLSNLKQTKHFLNYERLIESLIIVYIQNQDIFIKLIDLYLNNEFQHSQLNSITYQKKLNQKRLSCLSISQIEKLFDLSIELKSIDISISCSQIINKPDTFKIIIQTYFNSSDRINFELHHANYKFIKKLFQNNILSDNLIIIKHFESFTCQLFNSNRYAIELFQFYFKQPLENVFDSFFFYCLECNEPNLYSQLTQKVISLFKQLNSITSNELEICFYFLSPLFELINNSFSAEILNDWFEFLEEKQNELNKQAKAIANSLIEQYHKDRTSIVFPTIVIKSSELCHI